MWGSFRNLVYRVHHKHLLATWFTIQSGAAIAAFCVLWSLVHCAWSLLIENEADSHCAPQQLLAESCCLMLFGVTFYRFSVGDLRYLYWMGAAEESLKEWERQRLKGDLIALNVRALAFTGLAQSISKLRSSFYRLPFYC